MAKDVEAGSAAPEQRTMGSPIFFTAATTVINTANTRAIEPDDLLAEDNSKYSVEKIHEVFTAGWKAEVAAELAAAAEARANPPPPPKNGKKSQPLRTASIFNALSPICKTSFRRGGLFFGLATLCGLLGPLILGRVVVLLEEVELCDARVAAAINGTEVPVPGTGLASDAVPDECRANIGWGYVLAGAMFVAKLTESFLMTHNNNLMLMMALRARSPILPLVPLRAPPYLPWCHCSALCSPHHCRDRARRHRPCAMPSSPYHPLVPCAMPSSPRFSLGATWQVRAWPSSHPSTQSACASPAWASRTSGRFRT